MSAQALTAYSLGLVGLIVVKVLAPGFYARQDVKTPVKIGVVTLLATLVMNLAFIYPLRHAGLALAIGLGACINAALLYRTLRRRGIFQPLPGWRRFGVQIALALLAMGTVLWLATGGTASWLSGGLLLRAGRLTLIVLAGAATYFAALWLLGIRPRHFIKRAA
jgi:putative peptidoglycan lipid II flippase